MMAAGADGVHVGQSDMPAAIARKMIGSEKILGVSAGTLEEALKAEQDGADYLGVGAMYRRNKNGCRSDCNGDTERR